MKTKNNLIQVVGILSQAQKYLVSLNNKAILHHQKNPIKKYNNQINLKIIINHLKVFGKILKMDYFKYKMYMLNMDI